MKHLQKLAEGFVGAPDVNNLLASKSLDLHGSVALREEGNDHNDAIDTPAAKEFPDLKNRGRGIMALVGGVQLGCMQVVRIDAKGKLNIANLRGPFRTYVAVLYATEGLLAMAMDESAPLRGGDYWWLEPSQWTWLINNSDDDCIVMLVEVRVDP